MNFTSIRKHVQMIALATVCIVVGAQDGYSFTRKAKQTNDQIVFWQGNYTGGAMDSWAKLLSHFDVVVLSNIYDLNNCIISVPLPKDHPQKWHCTHNSRGRILNDTRRDGNYAPPPSEWDFNNRTPYVNLDMQAIPMFKWGTAHTPREFVAKIRSYNPHVKIYGYIPSSIDELMADDPLVINYWKRKALDIQTHRNQKVFLERHVIPRLDDPQSKQMNLECDHPGADNGVCKNFIWTANKLKSIGVDGVFIDYFSDDKISPRVRDSHLSYVHLIGMTAMLNVLDNQKRNIDFVNNSPYATANDIILLEGWYYRAYEGLDAERSVEALKYALNGKTKVAALATLNGATTETTNCNDPQAKAAYAAFWKALFDTNKTAASKAYFGYQPSHLGTSAQSQTNFPNYLNCSAADYWAP